MEVDRGMEIRLVYLSDSNPPAGAGLEWEMSRGDRRRCNHTLVEAPLISLHGPLVSPFGLPKRQSHVPCRWPRMGLAAVVAANSRLPCLHIAARGPEPYPLASHAPCRRSHSKFSIYYMFICRHLFLCYSWNICDLGHPTVEGTDVAMSRWAHDHFNIYLISLEGAGLSRKRCLFDIRDLITNESFSFVPKSVMTLTTRAPNYTSHLKLQ